MTKLGEVLRQTDAVIFVGAGVSAWSGLPTWSGLLEELAIFIGQQGGDATLVTEELRRGELLQAASYGFDLLTKAQIAEFMRRACRVGAAHPHAIHQRIVSLGPKCFITTNYDDLLEQSLKTWCPGQYHRKVTNRQLTEMADIVHAKASNYVFKPHGDVDDSESIILSKEQYRQLLPQGERHTALEALKTIMVSRPVVYLGFGLRDPDFSYVKDLIFNTYRGGERQHYAVMPDVSPQEANYWRRHYGLQLIGYKTTENERGGRDHGELMHVLDQLAGEALTQKAQRSTSLNSATVVLALARHAASLSRVPRKNPEIPIFAARRVTPERTYAARRPIADLLDQSPVRSIICGLPGAGKTYALRRSAAAIAEALHAACLKDDFGATTVVVPVLVDLKLYRGSLDDLISGSMPAELSFKSLSHSAHLIIYMDSFNEMPRSYIDDGSYLSDLQALIETCRDVKVVIGSRTTDGLDQLGFSVFDLDDIDEEYVSTALRDVGVLDSHAFYDELLELFRKPFYFQLLNSGAISLPDHPRPRDIYESMLLRLTAEFNQRFSSRINIKSVLSRVAFQSIEDGMEAFPAATVVSAVVLETTRVAETVDADDVVNWLVAKSLLIPHVGARLSFVHQSVTEFLAALQLSVEFGRDHTVLTRKLTLNRWDQALYLTLGLLPAEAGEAFVEMLVEKDLILALNAVKYAEIQTGSLVSKLLTEAAERYRQDDELSWEAAEAISRSVSVGPEHESVLRALMNNGGSIGGSAAGKLLDLLGNTEKPAAMSQVIQRADDYNFCANGVLPSLEPLTCRADIADLVRAADTLERTDGFSKELCQGFMAVAAGVLHQIPLNELREEIGELDEFVRKHPTAAEIICESLWDNESEEALALAGDLLVAGATEAAVALSFIVGSYGPEREFEWLGFTPKHVELLCERLESGDEWVVSSLKSLCARRAELARVVQSRAEASGGLVAVAYSYICNSEKEVFESLERLVSLGCTDDRRYHKLVRPMRVDWTGREELIKDLLDMRLPLLSTSLIDAFGIDLHRSVIRFNVSKFSDWFELMELEEDVYFRDRVGMLIGCCWDKESMSRLLAEFNGPGAERRSFVASHILRHLHGLTSDDFSEDAIDFLVADLQSSEPWGEHILGNLCTEKFVEQKLLPLLRSAPPPAARRIRAAVRRAGSRHGRRYDLNGEAWT